MSWPKLFVGCEERVKVIFFDTCLRLQGDQAVGSGLTGVAVWDAEGQKSDRVIGGELASRAEEVRLRACPWLRPNAHNQCDGCCVSYNL
jgi:hypothetical protein